jgi:hypothetical protein
MLSGRLSTRLAAFVASLGLLAVAAPLGWAGPLPHDHACGCRPSTAVFSSPFFGYYPTCWRLFPPGQPTCPPIVKPPRPEEQKRMPKADEDLEGEKMKPAEPLSMPAVDGPTKK